MDQNMFYWFIVQKFDNNTILGGEQRAFLTFELVLFETFFSLVCIESISYHYFL